MCCIGFPYILRYVSLWCVVMLLAVTVGGIVVCVAFGLLRSGFEIGLVHGIDLLVCGCMLYNYYLCLVRSRFRVCCYFVELFNSVVVCVMIVVCIGFILGCAI